MTQAEGECPHCHGSKIEFVYGGHGNVLEEPCSYCSAPAAPGGAEEEAERRYPDPPPASSFPDCDAERDAFIAGAAWQREQAATALTSSERAETLAIPAALAECGWTSAEELLEEAKHAAVGNEFAGMDFPCPTCGNGKRVAPDPDGVTVKRVILREIAEGLRDGFVPTEREQLADAILGRTP
jgi:hypothetical protein